MRGNQAESERIAREAGWESEVGSGAIFCVHGGVQVTAPDWPWAACAAQLASLAEAAYARARPDVGVLRRGGDGVRERWPKAYYVGPVARGPSRVARFCMAHPTLDDLAVFWKTVKGMASPGTYGDVVWDFSASVAHALFSDPRGALDALRDQVTRGAAAPAVEPQYLADRVGALEHLTGLPLGAVLGVEASRPVLAASTPEPKRIVRWIRSVGKGAFQVRRLVTREEDENDRDSLAADGLMQESLWHSARVREMNNARLPARWDVEHACVTADSTLEMDAELRQILDELAAAKLPQVYMVGCERVHVGVMGEGALFRMLMGLRSPAVPVSAVEPC